MTTLTQDSKASEGQVKQITRVATDAADKAVSDYIAEFGLDKNGAQRIHANGDEVTAIIRTAIFTAYKELSVSDRYKDEEVKSTYGYLSGYKPKGITEQTNILRQLFPGVGFADEKLAQGELPKGAEGWFAIPKWEKFAPTYGEAVQKVLDKIKETRRGQFYNYREGQLGPDQLRQSARTAAVFQKLGDEQKDHDILVVPAQFGLRHRGRSVRRVREVLLGNEFGLGAFAVGIMILTHPERLMNYDDLWVDCAGDEFAPDAGGKFSDAPFFSFYGVKVEFGASDVSIAFGHYGTASGFSPQ
jgi:hypothetical protein